MRYKKFWREWKWEDYVGILVIENQRGSDKDWECRVELRKMGMG
jgi:hypothetical protein